MFKKLMLAATALTLPLGVAGVGNSPVEAGCNINVEVHNTGSVAYTVDWGASKVKVKGGTYKKIGNSVVTVNPGQTKTEDFKATFNCGAKRRYQIKTTEGTNSRTTYVPSTTGWTTSQTVHRDIAM